MTFLSRLAAASLLALLSVLSTPEAEAQRNGPPRLNTGHTLTLSCSNGTRGRLQECTISLRAHRARAQAPWNGALREVAFQTRGQFRTASLQRQSDGSYTGIVRLPRRARVRGLLLRDSQGGTSAYGVPHAADDGEDDDPEEDPPEEDPPEEDPEDDEDDEECSVVGCDMVDPWTCECITDMKPMEIATTNGGSTTIRF